MGVADTAARNTGVPEMRYYSRMPSKPMTPDSAGARANRPAALLALFAGLAGICALFAGTITARDWIVDRAHAKWPIKSAIIENSAVESEHPFSRDGGGTVWYVDVHIQLPTDNGTTRAHIMSASAREQGGSRAMQEWVARHPAGSTLPVRVDPANATRAELVNSEEMIMERHISADLVLTGVALLLALTAWLASIGLRRRLDGTSRPLRPSLGA